MKIQKIKQLTVVLCLLFCMFMTVNSRADDWPQWRGTNGDGISKETGLVKSWSTQGPEILWRIPVGEGFSAMSVKNDKVYTMWTENNEEYICCVDGSNGKILWKSRVDTMFKEKHWSNGPRTTPVVDNDFVYGISASGKLCAVHVKTGKPAWSHNLVQEYGTIVPQWGYTSTPLLYKNLVIVDAGGKENYAFIAFNRHNGTIAWNAQTDTVTYSSPLAVKINNQQQLVFFNRSGLHGISPKDGKQLWHYDWRAANIPSPVFVAPDKIFVSCSYKKGAALVKIENNGGNNETSTIWSDDVMKNHMSSSLLVDDHIYGFDDATLKCIVATTGEQKWTKRRLGKGSFIYADGQLIVLSERGKLVLIEANPEKCVETASFQILKGRCWTPPALSNGKLYLRNKEEMVCVNMKKTGRK